MRERVLRVDEWVGGWMDGGGLTRFYLSFKSISVISRRWEGDNERQ